MRFTANLSLFFPEHVRFSERCARVAAQGFKHVELLFPYDLAISEYTAPLKDYGLQTILINTPVRPNQPGVAALPGYQAQFKTDFELALKKAQALNASAIHVMAGQTAAIDQNLWSQTLLENLAWALNQIKGLNLTLQLEALNRQDAPGYAYWSPLQISPILAALNSPQVRLQFDFYHTLKENLPLLETLEQTLPFVAHIQLANPIGRHEPNLQAYPEILHALQRLQTANYLGYIGCEYKPLNQLETGLDFLTTLQKVGLCSIPRGSLCT